MHLYIPNSTSFDAGGNCGHLMLGCRCKRWNDSSLLAAIPADAHRSCSLCNAARLGSVQPVLLCNNARARLEHICQSLKCSKNTEQVLTSSIRGGLQVHQSLAFEVATMPALFFAQRAVSGTGGSFGRLPGDLTEETSGREMWIVICLFCQVRSAWQVNIEAGIHFQIPIQRVLTLRL